jgi:putative tributyrin esterase
VVKVVEEILQSSLMERELPFRALLPENYEASGAFYPVLYLLHGLFGSCDNWVELTGLTEYLRTREFIVVLPEGENAWYTDSVTVEKNKFESFFINELIPAVETRYRIDGSRAARAVAGLSMGGFGALKFALKRPDLFVFAGSMSGAFDAPQRGAANPGFDWETLRDSVLEAFGGEHSAARIDNDLFRLIGALPAEKISNIPQLYFDCGRADGFLKVNRKLAETLKEKKIAFEYKEIPGGHDWEYWDRQIRVMLEKVDKIFRRTADQS